MEIKRDLYLQRIVDRMHNGMIKVITGIRRSGKSYLLFTIFKNYLISQNVPEDHIIGKAWFIWFPSCKERFFQRVQ